VKAGPIVLVTERELVEPVDIDDEIDALSERQQIGQCEQLLWLFRGTLRDADDDDPLAAKRRDCLQDLAQRDAARVRNDEPFRHRAARHSDDDIIRRRGERQRDGLALHKAGGVGVDGAHCLVVWPGKSEIGMQALPEISFGREHNRAGRWGRAIGVDQAAVLPQEEEGPCHFDSCDARDQDRNNTQNPTLHSASAGGRVFRRQRAPHPP